MDYHSCFWGRVFVLALWWTQNKFSFGGKITCAVPRIARKQNFAKRVLRGKWKKIIQDIIDKKAFT